MNPLCGYQKKKQLNYSLDQAFVQSSFQHLKEKPTVLI